MENHGVAFDTRAKLAREKIEAMKAIWTQQAAEYHGEFINFDAMVAEPRPVQKPHPPVIVGGAFPHGARRALRYGDGWIPLSGRAAYGELAEYLPRFRQMASEAGRDLTDVPLSLTAVPQDMDTLKRYADLGVSRMVFDLPAEAAEKLLPILDSWAEMMQRVNA
jgi:alkanesulfonate monooxygenase SsuD/methylene tetrahydromethanopterin reductase-like flavin-dependent oxidoreductase (luciferase family)